MTLTGIQKAALLLTTLDTATATDLLKGQPQQTVQKIAMELSELDLKGQVDTDQASAVVQQFHAELTRPKNDELHIKSFVGSLLQNSAGKENASELQNKMQQAVIQRDPFVVIGDAAPVHLASVLQNESPQEVLSRLDEEKAQMTVWRMSQTTTVSRQTVLRIGETVHKHLLELQAQQADQSPEEDNSAATLRQIALVLGGLNKEKRDTLLKTIEKKDDESANMVRALMVTWEDIPRIEDKSLEEVSLMGTLKKKDIITAREEMVQPLRDANKAGELDFIEEED
jgi:flagellar motor switch protein FliG